MTPKLACGINSVLKNYLSYEERRDEKISTFYQW
jgi:hypothetical protein